ncbi:hypothetical protein GO013_12685 [Pseudodesulfovibrio sp. JC047]|nr:hypothetical protein [Pseudodesulfovibrio sp. JC047]
MFAKAPTQQQRRGCQSSQNHNTFFHWDMSPFFRSLRRFIKSRNNLNHT